MNEHILNALFNGVLTPFMAVVLIPRALREPNTGIYNGFHDIRLFYYGLIVACSDILIIYPRFGISIETLWRLVFSTSIPFLGGFVLVKVSDKFGFNIHYQIRKSGQSI